ncbi:helix-turn-helix transcriptional regulator [Saccharopolyspora sp. ASAGF58]|uniref:helix-turn-helix domain-containing protein n=1 Tax=Saccharopolyspora sp. ASAGF58 TaxID=2719023 RepID=UPI00143FC652|nr:helix-turn-helix transcriptional regulator [Saccharopolyspora sp. ASAGF58]QIZ33653.1 helix-turn-helix domain-containing protein [Saccharopolyspora sp. ASAGF58]
MSQDMGDVASATVRRWQLTESLRQLREQAGLTMTEAAEKLKHQPGKWSRSKLQRIETRDQGVKAREVEQLLDLYEVADADLRNWLLGLASTASERGYWLSFQRELPQDFHAVLNIEAELVAQRQFETMVVPGLLQTQDWARAVMAGGSPGVAADVIERRVLARIARQQILTKQHPMKLHAIIEEAVLERPIGTNPVMRRQLERLLDEGKKEHITIQVLPMTAGASPAVDGPFAILSLPDPVPDFGLAEAPGRMVYIEDRDAVREYTLRFGILTERALSPAKSAERLAQAARKYS